MPDLQEVFRMATQKVRPDPEALERQHRKQRGKLVRERVAVYALAAGLVVAGVVVGISTLRSADDEARPGTEGEPGGLTVEKLAGVWWPTRGFDVGGPSPLLSFGADGTFAVDNAGRLDTAPFLEGTYRVEGDTIVLSDSNRGCPDMRWTASLRTNGMLAFTITDPASLDCLREPGYYIEGVEFTYVRISPGSPASAELASRRAEQEPVLRSLGAEPPGELSELAGIWLLDGGEHLLRIGSDGTYAIADAGTLVADPDDVGTVELENRSVQEVSLRVGTLTFTSGPESRTCSEGTRTVWTEVLFISNAMAADVPEGACGEVPAGRATWSVVSRAG